MPKQSLPNSAAAGRSSATGINAMTKRRKVTDVSFLKSGSVRSGVRTQVGRRSVSKNMTSGNAA